MREIAMIEPAVICPNCATGIKLTESLAARTKLQIVEGQLATMHELVLAPRRISLLQS